MSDEKTFLEIDTTKLDREWCEHVRVRRAYGLEAAKARLKHAEAKAEFELTKSDLFLECRENPTAFGLEMGEKKGAPPETTIEHAITRHKRYIKAQQRMFEVKYELDVLDDAISVLEHKKKGLEKIVDLELADWRSQPKSDHPEVNAAMNNVMSRASNRRASAAVNKSKK